MSSKRYTDEFKTEPIKQITERGYPASEVVRRLGVSTHSLYAWRQDAGITRDVRRAEKRIDLETENARLRAELRHVKEERNILKKLPVLCQCVRGRYAFIRDHRNEFRITAMCRVLKVERSGFYAWLAQPQSVRTLEDTRLKPLIEVAYLESGGVYGNRNIYRDLREVGELVGRGRIERLMRAQVMRLVRTPRKHRYRAGKSATVAPNRLQRLFAAETPNHAWVTDITYLRTWEGCLYLVVVLDMYSRHVVGWSMKPTLARELALVHC